MSYRKRRTTSADSSMLAETEAFIMKQREALLPQREVILN